MTTCRVQWVSPLWRCSTPRHNTGIKHTKLLLLLLLLLLPLQAIICCRQPANLHISHTQGLAAHM
jgi:hypothetical protein